MNREGNLIEKCIHNKAAEGYEIAPPDKGLSVAEKLTGSIFIFREIPMVILGRYIDENVLPNASLIA